MAAAGLNLIRVMKYPPKINLELEIWTMKIKQEIVNDVWLLVFVLYPLLMLEPVFVSGYEITLPSFLG